MFILDGMLPIGSTPAGSATTTPPVTSANPHREEIGMLTAEIQRWQGQVGSMSGPQRAAVQDIINTLTERQDALRQAGLTDQELAQERFQSLQGSRVQQQPIPRMPYADEPTATSQPATPLSPPNNSPSPNRPSQTPPSSAPPQSPPATPPTPPTPPTPGLSPEDDAFSRQTNEMIKPAGG